MITKSLMKGPKPTVVSLYLVTSSSRKKSKTPFFVVMKGREPNSGKLLGPGGSFLHCLNQTTHNIVKRNIERKILIIFSVFTENSNKQNTDLQLTQVMLNV